jgi:F420-non-reducing hydrogenase large subunit
MSTLILEPLRWQDEAARITVCQNDSQPEVYFQIVSPKPVEALCCNRPVEELPRILPMLAPAHHLAGALALDRLFNVEPPPLAQNMRTALLQTQFYTAHLRRLFFLLANQDNPFTDFYLIARDVHQPLESLHLHKEIMHHLALAQEAETILGGRQDHPLTAVAGGVSRFLKDGMYERLAEIADACLKFACKLAPKLRGEIFSAEKGKSDLFNIEIPPLSALAMADDNTVELTDREGKSIDSFAVQEIAEKIVQQKEEWTYKSFAHMKDKEWQNLEQPEGLFFVGPLARFNRNQTATTPLAEEERQRLIDSVGPPPQYNLTTAVWVLLVELIQAAETLQTLSKVEKLAGPSIRTVPTKMDAHTWSALETPQGLIWHQYQVDSEGIVQEINILDTTIANNALKCLLAKQLVTEGLAQKQGPEVIKNRVAVGLLPF